MEEVTQWNDFNPITKGGATEARPSLYSQNLAVTLTDPEKIFAWRHDTSLILFEVKLLQKFLITAVFKHAV